MSPKPSPAARPLAVRLLEQKRIAHQLFAFDDTIRSAAAVAAAVGLPAELVYKTLVIQRDPPRGRPFLFMLPADSDVDLKALANTLGLKKLRMASHRDAERLTGLKVGGISALALIGRGFPVLLDEQALAHDRILVSAGQRGMDVALAVADLLALTGARPVSAR